jgi:hypothetical protein
MLPPVQIGVTRTPRAERTLLLAIIPARQSRGAAWPLADVQAIRPYLEAGYGEITRIQFGADHQEPFISWAEHELLTDLREL